MSSIELGELNLKQGKHAVAFDIFFELAQFELSADAHDLPWDFQTKSF